MRIDANLSKAIPQAVQQAASQSDDFGSMLMDAVKEVNASQSQANTMRDQVLAGQPGVEVHDLMIAMERASVAMQLTVQVRNKLLEAYQEISRMQV